MPKKKVNLKTAVCNLSQWFSIGSDFGLKETWKRLETFLVVTVGWNCY